MLTAQDGLDSFFVPTVHHVHFVVWLFPKTANGEYNTILT